MKSLSILVLALSRGGTFAATDVPASNQLHLKSGCVGCNMADQKMVGPSYKDIALKYKARTDAVATLSQRVRQGSAGNWGSTPMAPNDFKKLNGAEPNALVT